MWQVRGQEVDVGNVEDYLSLQAQVIPLSPVLSSLAVSVSRRTDALDHDVPFVFYSC